MKKGDPTVAEVVRRERRHAGRRARTGDRGAEAIAAEALEDAAVRSAVLARYELAHGLEDDRRNVRPNELDPVFDATRETRQRCRGSSRSPQASCSSSPSRIPVASSTRSGSR